MKKSLFVALIFTIFVLQLDNVKAANSISCPVDLTEYTFANSKVTMDSASKISGAITINDNEFIFGPIEDGYSAGTNYHYILSSGGISRNDITISNGSYVCPIFYYTVEEKWTVDSNQVTITFETTYKIYTKSYSNRPEDSLIASTSGFVTDSITDERKTYKEWLESNNGEEEPEPEVIENACEIFGEETTTIIKYVLMLIRIGVPVLIVILTMLDFTKIILNAEDKEYKAAVSKLIKRIGVAVAIIILPIILTLIIEISGVLEQYGIADGDLFCSLF